MKNHERYLFRGICQFSGGWRYGDLTEGGKSIGGFAPHLEHNADPEYSFFPVLPETVGQWTGLVDKNGERIWEGDVVEYWTGQIRASTDEAFNAWHRLSDEEKEGYDMFKNGWEKVIRKHPVVFEKGGFKVAKGMPFFAAHLKPHEVTVIGNIHQNPELCEG